jgi:hypothetical protein
MRDLEIVILGTFCHLLTEGEAPRGREGFSVKVVQINEKP